jgi:hypothetical protein
MSLPEKILGDYVNTKNWEFQENVRKLSITIINNSDDPLHYNGWSSVIATLSLLPSYKDNLNQELIELSETICNLFKNFDLNKNVRGPVKKMLMYPLTEYPGWYDVDSFDEIPLNELNNKLNNKKYKLVVRSGKLYCDLPETDLKFQNNKIPHLTLINSDKFKKEYNKYDGIEIDDVRYTKLSSTYSFDYPPFKDVIVANVVSPTLTELLDSIGIKQSLHLTIYRVPREKFE